jgi:hypothetical protein
MPADLSLPTYSETLRAFCFDEQASPGLTLLLLFGTIVLLETAVLSRSSDLRSLVSLRGSLIANG